MILSVMRFISATVCLALFGLIAGCGGPSPNKLSGKVTLDGAAFPQATLQFFPPSSAIPSFTVTSKDDGSFEAVIPGDSKIPTGTYTVTAAKYELKKGSKAQVGDGMDMAQLAISGQATNVLPRKYHSVKESPLRYEVKFPGTPGELAVTSK